MIFNSKKSLIAFILFFSAAIYINTLANGFVFDDHAIVLNNSWIKSARNIPDIFLSSVWKFEEGYATSDYYRPMMHIIYLAQFHLFGFKPWGWHLMNVLAHSINGVLVFLVASVLLKRDGSSDPAYKYLFPFIAAAIFTSIPVNSEAVSWVACVTELFYTMFFLLAFYLYILFSERGGRGYYLLSLAAFFAATLFKEPAVLLPLILAGYDYSRKQAAPSIIKRYGPYMAIAAIYLLLRTYALKGGAREVFIEDPLMQSLAVFPAFAAYLYKLILPVRLSPFNLIDPVSAKDPGFILSVFITLAFISAVFFFRRISRAVIVFGMIITIPILPTFYLLFQNAETYNIAVVSERYLYLPTAGFAMLVSFCLDMAFSKIKKVKTRAVFILSIFAVIGVYATAAAARTYAWRNDYTLWKKTADDHPSNYFAHFMLGKSYIEDNNERMALAEFKESIRSRPRFTGSHHSLGLLYYSHGRLNDAEDEFRQVLAINPGNKAALYNIGLIYMDTGRWAESIEVLSTALRYSKGKDSLNILNALAISYVKTGRLDRARTSIDEALRIEAGNKEALENLRYLDRSKN